MPFYWWFWTKKDDTEVRLDEWDGGYIACWNPTMEAASFQKAKQVSFPYEGKMYEYSDKRIHHLSFVNYSTSRAYFPETQASLSLYCLHEITLLLVSIENVRVSFQLHGC